MSRASVLRGCVALTAAATVLTGCTDSGAGADAISGTGAPQVYQDDPAEISQLRTAAGLATCPEPAEVQEPTTEDRLPELTLTCLGDGPDVDLAAVGGVPYVVNVWAGWCGPCQDEMPRLQEVYEQAAGRVEVLGVDFQDTAVGGLSAAADFGITFPSVQDLDGDTRPLLRFAGLPFTAFVDADGRVVATHNGEIKSADELRDLIEANLGVRL